MRKIQGILFDCDGVLLDTESSLRKKMHDFLLENAENYTFSFEEFLNEVRGVNNHVLKEIFQKHKIVIPSYFFDEFDKFLINEYSNFAKKVLNVDLMLEELKDYPKAICSNNYSNIYSKALEKYNIDQYFKVKLGTDIIDRPKPDPCVYLEGAKRIGVPIENCLAIEDTPGIGLQAAKASKAGVVIGFTGSGSSAEELKENGADYTIDSLLELPKLINKLNNGG